MVVLEWGWLYFSFSTENPLAQLDFQVFLNFEIRSFNDQGTDF